MQCSARAEKLLRSNFAEMEDKVFVKVKNTIIVDATSAKGRDVAEKEGKIDAMFGEGREVAEK